MGSLKADRKRHYIIFKSVLLRIFLTRSWIVMTSPSYARVLFDETAGMGRATPERVLCLVIITSNFACGLPGGSCISCRLLVGSSSQVGELMSGDVCLRILAIVPNIPPPLATYVRIYFHFCSIIFITIFII